MRALLQPLIEKDLFYFVVGALVSADNQTHSKKHNVVAIMKKIVYICKNNKSAKLCVPIL